MQQDILTRDSEAVKHESHKLESQVRFLVPQPIKEDSMVSRTVYQEVEIDIGLEDFDTDDLIEELESRGHTIDDEIDIKDVLTAVWIKRRLGQDYQAELDELIYQGLGRIV